ncbi:MAG: prepilin peptidase [Patescibacteria group bacterium]|nr:prepilin peptidase [Patescibacteria group bacterium]
MDILVPLLYFVFGTIIGSFLNVVALRYKTGRGIGGRSTCMSCGKKLEWMELIPILSFVFLRGACRKCKSKISWQYPIIEFMAGVIFALIFIKFPPITLSAGIVTVLQILAASVLLVITIHDMKHKIIPDALAVTFGVIALATLFLGGDTLWHIPTWESILSGPILAMPLALIWLVSRGKWMGLGDAKLMLGIGWLTGINAGVNALILSFWIGAIFSVAWLLITYGKFKRNTEIPFGTYLILGMYIVIIFGVQVLDVGLVRDMIGLYL